MKVFEQRFIRARVQSLFANWIEIAAYASLTDHIDTRANSQGPSLKEETIYVVPELLDHLVNKKYRGFQEFIEEEEEQVKLSIKGGQIVHVTFSVLLCVKYQLLHC